MANKTEVTVPAIIDSVDALIAKMKAMREAQKIFATYTQEQVDKIFYEAAKAANQMRIPLAKMAVEETGMGVVEDKVIKNNYAAEYIYNCLLYTSHSRTSTRRDAINSAWKWAGAILPFTAGTAAFRLRAARLKNTIRISEAEAFWLRLKMNLMMKMTSTTLRHTLS